MNTEKKQSLTRIKIAVPTHSTSSNYYLRGGGRMDAQRAQEIADSAAMTKVLCNGESIYIEHVDQDEGLATIHPIDNPEQKQSVAVTELQED